MPPGESFTEKLLRERREQDQQMARERKEIEAAEREIVSDTIYEFECLLENAAERELWGL